MIRKCFFDNLDFMLYHNDDLSTVRKEWRNWSTIDYIAIWLVIACSVPTILLASGLVQDGFAWWQSLLVIFIANVILLIPLLLNSEVGYAYGIGFAAHSRVSFGIRGSLIPSAARGMIAAIWFGIQIWLGGYALWNIIAVWLPHLSHMQYHELLQKYKSIGIDCCVVLFWFINLFFLAKGMEKLRRLFFHIAWILVIIIIVLFYWSIVVKGSLTKLHYEFVHYTGDMNFKFLFFTSISLNLGFFTPICLNISDFSRFAKSKTAYRLGQIIGLPLALCVVAFLGLVISNALSMHYEEIVWNPLLIDPSMHSPILYTITMLAIVFATLFSNISANGVAGAYCFTNIFPRTLNFQGGAIVLAIIAMLVLPWKLLANPHLFLFTWLNSSSAILGPILGIMLVDYYYFRQQKLYPSSLYAKHSCYWYGKGINWLALIAFILGFVVNLPGFIMDNGWLQKGSIPIWLDKLFDFGWFAGVIVASIIYWILMKNLDHYIGGFNQEAT